MEDSILFSGGCCNNITEKQLKSLSEACITTTVVDSNECERRLNTCGMSVEQLLSTYEIYNPQKGLYKKWGDIPLPWNTDQLVGDISILDIDDRWKISKYTLVTSYLPGDRVLFIEQDGYELSLYEAIEEVTSLPGILDNSKWEKICSIKTTIPVGLPTKEELYASFPLYEAGLLYKRGDIFIVLGNCADSLCAYVVNQDIPNTEEVLNEYKVFKPGPYWEKLYCIKTGKNKCLGPRRTREVDEAYELVEIGSKGHYVERPLPFVLKPTAETLDEKLQRISPRVLTPCEIDYLTGDVLPEPEPESDELVIYYPNTAPPLSTVEGVAIEEIQNDIWNTFNFQDVNALSIPLNSSGYTTWWLIDFASENFDTESGSLTVEFFARIGTNATNDNNNKTSGWLVEFRDSDQNQRVAVIGEFDADPFYRILAVNDSEVYPEGDDFWTYQQNVASEAAANMQHFSLQIIENAQIVAHFNGTKVYDSSRTVSSMRYLIFYIFSNEVSDTAISQIRISNSALYGTGNFTPPSTAFFTP